MFVCATAKQKEAKINFSFKHLSQLSHTLALAIKPTNRAENYRIIFVTLKYILVINKFVKLLPFICLTLKKPNDH